VKLGLATREAIRGNPDDGLRGLEPDLVAQWVSLTPSYAPLFPRPSNHRSVIYLESHMDGFGYRDILDGQYDERLHDLNLTLPSNSIIRWDHEMNAKQNGWRRWGLMDPPLYRQVFRYVAGKLQRDMFWCPMGGGTQRKLFLDYYPGDSVVRFVGFDKYDRGRRRPMPRLFRREIEALRKITDKPIIIGETETLRIPGLGGRAKWLASARDLKGVWGLILFDVNMPNERPPRFARLAGVEQGRDWRMGSGQERVFRKLQRG
jgi:hypothetical protein